MPLTNPNKVVTEERLSEFYGQILPYMGGMPDVLANKFSKGDLYSTDEKMIGQWIDGKPLYQKTIQMPYTQNWDYAHPYSEIGLANLSYVQRKGAVKFHYVYGSDNFWYDEHYHSSSDWAGSTFGLTDFRIGSSQDTSRISEVIFTLQYTKTTDSAVSIGVDTDYSTTEKIVGTWIDGKPIWQKTIYISALPNATTGHYSVGVQNIDFVIEITGMGYDAEWSPMLPLLNPANINASIGVYYNDTDKTIDIITMMNRSNQHAYITIKYVKTAS